MSEEMTKSKTLVKHDQLSLMTRIKKKRRKKDLDQVRRQVLDTRRKLRQRSNGERGLNLKVETSLRKTLNKFAQRRQNNDDETTRVTRDDTEEIRQKTLCDRLLPQPSIGIYRNAISGKQVQKTSDTSAKNGRRQPGDVIQLLNNDRYSSKKTEDVGGVDDKQRDSLKTSDDSSRRGTAVDDKLTPIEKDLDNNRSEKLQNTRIEKNSGIQSVRRWRWSPVTCFEEFCAKFCIERFINCPLDYFPAPGDKITMFLRDVYAESNDSNCDFSILCEESEKSPVQNYVEQAKLTTESLSDISCSAIDDENLEWSRNPQMIHDQSLRYDDSHDLSKPKKRNRLRSSAIETDNLPVFVGTSRDFGKMEKPSCYPRKSVKSRNNLDKLNHLSYEVDESLKNVDENHNMIPTPSVVFRLFRHDKFFHVNSKDFDDIKATKGHTISNYPINSRDLMINKRHKTNEARFFVDYLPDASHQYSKDTSEMLKGFLRFSDDNPRDKSLTRGLHFKSDVINTWQRKSLYNKTVDGNFKGNAVAMQDAVVKNLKVLSFHDDYFNQANQLNEKKFTEVKSKHMQPLKYFAVDNKYDIRSCPRRIAVYPNKYSYNTEEGPLTVTANPFYQNGNTDQVVVPRPMADPVILFNPEKRKYKTEYDVVNLRNMNKQVDAAQWGPERPADILHTEEWINSRGKHYLSPNYYQHYRSDDNKRLDRSKRGEILFDTVNSYYY
ncbi:uncharacterized protein LOC135168442 [Diachasmimorpha longicaudata]|uniref:uncharacterized protein LOC135168442 n=1 Tax=Diachasmimorpha longicaudata TaxID=58733 RepID=UPI0030B8DB9A